jgi:hypothetical protein
MDEDVARERFNLFDLWKKTPVHNNLTKKEDNI